MTNPKIDLDGTKRWYNSNGERHRDNDLPAVECAHGTKYWYSNGKLHRDNGPAVEYASGFKEWYKNGQQVEEPKAQTKEDHKGMVQDYNGNWKWT